MTFTDDFERTDLGPDWADGPLVFGRPRANSYLSGGAWVAADNSSVDAMGAIRHVSDAGADQVIEAGVGNFFQGHDPSVPENLQWVEGEIFLFAQVASDSYASVGVWVFIDSGGSGATLGDGKCYMEIFTTDAAGDMTSYNGADTSPLTGWQSNPNYVIRFEVTAAGHCRAYFEGSLLVEGDVPPAGGQHLGIGMMWYLTDYPIGSPPNPGQSLRFEWVTGGIQEGGGWRIGSMGPPRWGVSALALARRRAFRR
jgi:hypothetical protein